MVVLLDGLDKIIEAANKTGNGVATLELGEDGTVVLTFQDGLRTMLREEKQQLENSLEIPAVVGAGDPTVQRLEALYNPPVALPAAEVDAQAVAAQVITDELNVHLTHTEQAAGAVGVAATIPASALIAPPEAFVSGDVNVELLQPDNQPPILSISFDKETTSFAKVEEQLRYLATSGALGMDGDALVEQALIQIKQQYPELATSSKMVQAEKPIDIAQTPAQGNVAQGNPSIEGPEVRRRPPTEAAQAVEGGMPLTAAAPQITASQYEGVAIQASARTSSSDINAIAR